MKKIILVLALSLITSLSFAGTITEQTIIGKIEILPDGQMQIREDRIIYDNGVEIARTYHRKVIAPTDDISKEDIKVQAVANVVQTKEVKDAYIAKITEKK